MRNPGLPLRPEPRDEFLHGFGALLALRLKDEIGGGYFVRVVQQPWGGIGQP